MEDNILAYLDGSLSEGESAELLERLALSPEKRAILEEHLRMREVLALGRKPFEVPHATEQLLMAQLPALSQQTVTYAGSSVLSSAWSAVSSWVMSHALATAGSAAAIAVIGGLLWNANVQSKDVAKQNIAVISRLNENSNVVSQQSSISVAHNVSTELSQRSHKAVAANTELAQAPEPQSEQTNAANEEQAATVSSVTARNIAAAIPSERIAHTISEIVSPPLDRYHPISIGVREQLSQVFLPIVYTGGTAPTDMSTHGLPELTFDYDLNPNIAVGFEFGYTYMGNMVTSQLPNDGNKVEALPGYTPKYYTTSIDKMAALSVLASAHWTVDEIAMFPFRVGVAGGETFNGDPIGVASFGISRTLTSSFVFDMSFAITGVWGSSAVMPSDAVTGTTGVHLNTSTQKPFTYSFGACAGLRYRI